MTVAENIGFGLSTRGVGKADDGAYADYRALYVTLKLFFSRRARS